MTGKKNSINYIVAVKEKEKQWTLIEYKLKWNKDKREEKEEDLFEEPELLGDSKLFGAEITEMELYYDKESKTTKGVWITTKD